MMKAIVITLVLTPLLAFLTAVSEAAPAVNIRSMLASPVDLTVYSVDRKLVIGHAHFTIKEAGRTVEIIGSTRYGNGEHDWERIMLEYQQGNPLPAVTSYQSNFLAPDGSAQLVEKADAKSGQASCRWGSQFGDISYEDKLEFGSDAYAGASSIVPLQYTLKTGGSSVHFQVFDCAPKPALYNIDAKLDDGVAHWAYYPGELAKMGLTPDLGWLNLVARPFIPDISVWFDPKEGYQYIGTFKDRFYRGRRQVLVRNNPGRAIGTDSAQQTAPSEVANDPAKASN
ncbi:MAG TPA: hypothetical protein VGH29_12470 [Candidatus Binataceae bacterium]